MQVLAGGYNPAFGRDPGPPPPYAAPTGPLPAEDFGPPPPGTTRTIFPPFFSYPGATTCGQQAAAMAAAAYYPYYPAPFGGYPQPPPPWYGAAAGAAPQPPPQGPCAAYAIDPHTGQLYQYISNLNTSQRAPTRPPIIDPDFPAANLINSTGGAGAEPGYNYFFPTQHAKVVVLRCAKPPWEFLGVPGEYDALGFYATHVPAGVTMAELLVGFGATNEDRGRNVLFEVYPQGGGRWGKREMCKGDDPVMMARTVRDMGWVEKREGWLPTVYLWIVKG